MYQDDMILEENRRLC